MQVHRHRFRDAARGSITLVVGLLVWLGAHTHAEASDRYILSLGGGASVSTQSELRDVFEKAKSLSVSLASRVSGKRTWVFAEAGWESAEGDPFVLDPTFEIEQTRLTRIPLSVGIRADVTPSAPRSALVTQLGYGVQWVFLTWDPPLGKSETKSTFGGFAEIRSSYAIGESMGVWIRPRVSLLFETDFDAQPDINSSTVGIDLGLSWSFGSMPSRRPSAHLSENSVK